MVVLIQVTSGIAAGACAVLLALTGYQSRDYITQYAHYTYAIVLAVASLTYFALAFQMGAQVSNIVKVLTPIGWGALAILLARGLARERGR